MTVEAIVLTRNEEHNIGDCLRSLLWADGLTVFDSGSEDGTLVVAERLGVRTLVHPFADYGSQRDAALEAAWGDWVFFVDADERCTPELALEVRSVVREAKAGWWVPRENYILGRVIRHGGWYPDYQLRLLRRGAARYDPSRPVHETVLLDGDEGWLEHPLVHYNYHSLGQFCRKQAGYSRLEVQSLCRAGEVPRVAGLLSRPYHEFRHRYFELGGYREGIRGLALCLFLAWYKARAYACYLASARDRPAL